MGVIVSTYSDKLFNELVCEIGNNSPSVWALEIRKWFLDFILGLGFFQFQLGNLVCSWIWETEIFSSGNSGLKIFRSGNSESET
ncbi:hypothetical protein C1645_841742 [Glomus cerebriforme]|uniref:Uncharacterized protein n=1 Tax=Glomus cerebriforme TaxID=658196 RepID=A0A397RXL0_9GLOM|nr:hypothetical protein C1645_841742 [Glomus cerebriforme]